MTDNFIKKIRNKMREDGGVSGDLQRLETLTWMLFLKIYSDMEENWLFDDNYKSVFPEELKWKNWAHDDGSNKVLTGDDLLKFVNDILFPFLKGKSVSYEGKTFKMSLTDNSPIKHKIIKFVFDEQNQYMKDGIILRQIINIIDFIDFNINADRHEFGDIYEKMLKSLQDAGQSGEYYTPRGLTDFIVKIINPRLGEKIADFACGTGGFLISTLNWLKEQTRSDEDVKKYNSSVFGIEKKQIPYFLAITNMLIHNVDEPNIIHDNSLEINVRDYKEDDKFNIILMNPPYGGTEQKIVQQNFPLNLRSSETADLFMSVIMYRLKKNGRCAVVLPDGFLFGEEQAKIELKKKLLDEFNLHTIIRLPKSVFAPYTSIATNVLFFDNTTKTKDIWFYRLDMPKNQKNFNKTNPIKIEHFSDVIEWWDNRKEIIDAETETYKSKSYTYDEIVENKYNLDLCGYPKIEEEILDPFELIENYKKEKSELSNKIDDVLEKITKILNEEK